MTPRYIYLLSDHDEHGSEHVQAVENREDLLALLRRRCQADWPDIMSGIMARAAALLERSDESLSAPRDAVEPGSHPENLMRGWGGLQLHVVKVLSKGDGL